MVDIWWDGICSINLEYVQKQYLLLQYKLILFTV